MIADERVGFDMRDEAIEKGDGTDLVDSGDIEYMESIVTERQR